MDLKRSFDFFGFLLACVVIFACKEKTNQITIKQNQGYAIGTSYNVQYEVDSDDTDYQQQIDSVFQILNRSLSTYIPTSDISKINKGDTTVVVDEIFREVFLSSKKIWAETDGIFDPTVGALVNAWGFGPEKPLKQLSKQKIDSILEFTGLDKVRLNMDGTVVKKHPNLYIDFNALGKGYAIDLIGRVLDKRNVKNYLIEVGGEVLAKGVKPTTKKPWVVGIDSPFQVTEERIILKAIKISDAAMATSGNYRKFRVDPQTGERYVHTINPKTGYSAKSNVLSVSVLAKTCMEADAYATAFMAMPFEKTKSLLSASKDLDALIMYLDDEDILQYHITDGFQEKLLD
ncbi:FAD:protein FMN transferase [Sungkyunkwania multivorans]|uniref:FAD:protein FMN transferase n=1 Tax=Sungkyunkwania multivorans TaxID=1173618 RepID=A0ABW3D0M8_9FLAO